MVRNKVRENRYNWECEKRIHRKTLETHENCNARATTDCVNGLHTLRGTPTDHNHAPEAHRATVIDFRSDIKKRAHSTRDKPSQILQEVVSNIPLSIQPYLPGPEAVRKIIKRRRRKSLPAEPTTLEDINIPESLRNTFAGELFLLRESQIENDKILIFSTKFEIEKLVRAKFWIMDGTFKTVPNIFLQMYTIHAPVGGINSRILPLVYVLMSSKNQKCYEHLFQDLIEIGNNYGYELNPACIITDFEKAAINAIHNIFPECVQKGCFFHLAQNVWRKIQSCGLATAYGTDEHFSLQLRYIPALAFLQPNEIITAFNEIKQYIPIEIYNWFDETYVNGKIRRTFRNGTISRSPPLFPPEFWSVSHNNELDIPRTQNKVESWHKRWKTLIGADHIGCLHIVSEMKKEQMNTIGVVIYNLFNIIYISFMIHN